MRFSLVFLFLWSCQTAPSSVPPQTYPPSTSIFSPKPKLAVVIVVDQMRADYLQKFADLFHGGFSYLLANGAVFQQAYVPYALTMTAPGHATIATGAFPSSHRVVQNHWFDRQKRKYVYAVADDQEHTIFGSVQGLSPRALNKQTIGDQLKVDSPQSKIFTLALKDRAAILLGGNHPDGVYWYNSKDGSFVTSSYYRQDLPAWLLRFNQSDVVLKHFATGWSRLLEPSAYERSGADQVAAEAYGEKSVFPYVFADGTEEAKKNYYERIKTTPFGDELMFTLAQELIQQEQLGVDAIPDILLLSCTSADLIGHAFGPHSHEIEDYYLRLDQYLLNFLQFLDQKIGKEAYVLMLSSDHGVVPLPEEQLSHNPHHARRVTLEDLSKTATKVILQLAKKLHLPPKILLYVSDEGIWLDTQLAEKYGVEGKRLRASVAQELQQKISYIAEALTSDMLTTPQEGENPWVEMYRRSFDAERSPDILLRYKPGDLIGSESHGTAHGSPYEYDTHVPLIFLGRGIQAENYAQKVNIIDIAPTVADLLGFPITDVQGQSLAPLLLTNNQEGITHDR